MSFLKKNVNYSKIKVLLNSIEKTGEFSIGKDTNKEISYDYLIPNNKKYYLLITKKQLLEQQKYDILHFFPDHNELLENRSFDFYLKIDYFFDDEFLLEGYLYKSDDKYEYLLTDILVRNNEIVNVSFELRYSLLNEIIQKIGREKLMYLNNHMTINIHPVFDDENQNLVKIFKNNFIYNSQIQCLEKVCNFIKRRYIDNKHIDNKHIEDKHNKHIDNKHIEDKHNKHIEDKHNKHIDNKHIEKGKYTDVYNVYNYETNNFEGILYIKGISESKKMKLLFNNTYIKVKINCIWNRVFSKWQPIFN